MALNIDELEAAARERLPRSTYDYYAGAAWDGATLGENRAAYGRLAIHPHVLRDVSQRSTECELLGAPLAMPILAAPTAFHRLACGRGEVSTVLGVGAAKTLMVLSSLSTCRLEDVATHAAGPLWFQLYINRDRGFTRDLVARAVASGYRAIVVTVDTPVWGTRENDLRNKFHLPEGIEAVNLLPAETTASDQSHRGSGMAQILSWMLDPTLTWRDLEWLVAEAGVPVLVKGILRADDAREALRCGAAGVLVSNHGGRQLDGTPATVAVLPEIVDAVGGTAPVLVDGGIRRGTDVLKAIALGARAVLVGRPVLWGLATGGADGVTNALEMLRRELDIAMALAGCATLADITPDLVHPVG